jgi:hypothetical protein
MKQSTHIKVPAPLHARLKTLAERRGVTMVDLIHGVVRQAIDSGELADEVPGLKVDRLLDMDAEEHGPFVRITTPAGELPMLTQDDARAVAKRLAEAMPSDAVVDHHRLDKRGRWIVRYRGTAIELMGGDYETPDDKLTRVVLSVPLARDFARQIMAAAEGAVPKVYA